MTRLLKVLQLKVLTNIKNDYFFTKTEKSTVTRMSYEIFKEESYISIHFFIG